MSNLKCQITLWKLEIRNWKFPQGFTLIELLLVVSLLGVLTAVGFGSYGEYTASQELKASTSELREILQTAKSRAASQIKPAVCGDNPLEGYRVRVCDTSESAVACSTDGDYEMEVVCGDVTEVVDPPSGAPAKRFSKNVSVDQEETNTDSVLFRVQFQGADTGDSYSKEARIMHMK